MDKNNKPVKQLYTKNIVLLHSCNYGECN